MAGRKTTQEEPAEETAGEAMRRGAGYIEHVPPSSGREPSSGCSKWDEISGWNQD